MVYETETNILTECINGSYIKDIFIITDGMMMLYLKTVSEPKNKVKPLLLLR